MTLLVFENQNYKQLYPIAYTRPTFDTIIGMSSLLEKIIQYLPFRNISLFCRDYLKSTVQHDHKKYKVNTFPKGNELILIDGTVIMDKTLSKTLQGLTKDTVLTNGKQPIAARISGENISKIKKLYMELKQIDLSLIKAPKKKVHARTIQYVWETVHKNTNQLAEDLKETGRLGKHSGSFAESDGIHLVNKKNVFIAQGVKVYPLVVIDASSGPVYIDQGTTIAPNVTIRGPVYIGKKCTINAGAKILSGTTIGECSKVGGEVAETIIHGYSNKQHDGFLGHSYIGAWCNLGANTNNSDLKNNYSSISIQIGPEDKDTYDTKQLFAGVFMGDHSKTGINTMFNTGTVVGAGCNIVGAGYPPKYIPSFTWMNLQSKPVSHNLVKFFETARAVCKRRKVQFTTVDKKMYTSLFNSTKNDRKSL